MSDPFWHFNYNPSEPGMYERMDQGSIRYSYWNGIQWGMLGHTRAEAMYWKTNRSQAQYLPWREIQQ